MTDSSFNIEEEYKRTQIKKILQTLDEELVGLEPVKKRIAEIAALLVIDEVRKKNKLTYVFYW
jgi:ATP-dependent Lon protease